MKLIQRDNPENLDGALPVNGYSDLDNGTLKALLATFDSIPLDIEGDLFGKIPVATRRETAPLARKAS